MSNFGTRFLTLIVLSVLMSGCALISLDRDNTFSRDSCLITGTVFFAEPVKKPIIVVAYSEVDGKPQVAHYTILHSPGSFELLVPQGRYKFFAFEDVNQNMILDPGEAAGRSLDETHAPVYAQGSGLVYDITIVLSRNSGIHSKVPRDILAKHISGPFKWHSTQAGSVIDINDPLFSAERGEGGFWSPFEFFRESGANIYFLEPYDPKRIPILLVHGAAGSPQDWRYFIKNIDRSRYQVWIYQYPSGARLKAMADIMSAKLTELYNRYKFEKLCITAHSMGGLTARRALTSNYDHSHYTKLFISISTPFGGEELAKTGVEKSPAVIPSWKDMAPNSDFIKKTFDARIPSTTKHYLFFGHKGSRNPLRPNNDSTVTLESMLDPRAQKEAIKVFGFNEDHISILNSHDVFAQYKLLLENMDKEGEALAGKKKKTNIRFRYTVNELSNAPPLWMLLLFSPLEKNNPFFVMSPDPLKPDQEINPIAKGNYDVGILAWGYKPKPSIIRIGIDGEKKPEVNFALEPQGMTGGQIVEGLKTEDQYWGFLPSLTIKEKIKSITLTGGGITRKLFPHEINEAKALQAIMNNRDYFHKDYFIFFDLPKGEYKIVFDIDGCSPVIHTATVDPKVVTRALKIKICN